MNQGSPCLISALDLADLAGQWKMREHIALWRKETVLKASQGLQGEAPHRKEAKGLLSLKRKTGAQPQQTSDDDEINRTHLWFPASSCVRDVPK